MAMDASHSASKMVNGQVLKTTNVALQTTTLQARVRSVSYSWHRQRYGDLSLLDTNDLIEDEVGGRGSHANASRRHAVF